MKDTLDEVLEKHNGSRVVVVSHATSITCLLLNYVDFSYSERKVSFKGNEFFDLNWGCPEVFKLVFDNKELISIENKRFDYV